MVMEGEEGHMYSVSEVAEKIGVGRSTLLYYERLGFSDKESIHIRWVVTGYVWRRGLYGRLF